MTESIANPKYSISLDETKSDLSGRITKPKLTKSLEHFHISLKHIPNEYVNVSKSSIYAGIFT